MKCGGEEPSRWTWGISREVAEGVFLRVVYLLSGETEEKEEGHSRGGEGRREGRS